MSSTVPVQAVVTGLAVAELDPLGPQRERHPAIRPGVGDGLARPDLLAVDRQAPRAGIDHPAVDQVERPDERGHERRAREVVDLRRRPDLLDPSVAHDHDPVGQREGLLLVVGDVDGGDPELALDRPDLLAQDDPDLGVERRQRLVEEQDLGLDRQRPGEGDALLLAARQLPRVAVRRAPRGA